MFWLHAMTSHSQCKTNSCNWSADVSQTQHSQNLAIETCADCSLPAAVADCMALLHDVTCAPQNEGPRQFNRGRGLVTCRHYADPVLLRRSKDGNFGLLRQSRPVRHSERN